MKGPSCILEDFKSSLDAMGYVNAIGLMIGNHWQGDQKSAASRNYSRKVESKGRAAHNRIIKMGRRSFELLDIFGEFGGFAILEREVDTQSAIVKSIMVIDIDPRLFSVFGLAFLPKVLKYLPDVTSCYGGDHGNNGDGNDCNDSSDDSHDSHDNHDNNYK
ncbi:hypothetical protein HPULCUR_001834 [Helicostylum pulchrum]|uniref:Uncharacterized protein n=1 Tax=Helicostylum pulchrum TaxID=562976 RepID=A0ABP9XQU3_9FUNG